MVRSLTDKRKSLLLFFLVFISYALIYMTKNCYSAAMASLVNENIMTKSETGRITAMFYIIYAPFQIVGGKAADRFSPSKLILLGTLGAGICNVLVYIFSGNYIAMIVIWSVNALVQFGIYPSIFKIIVTELCDSHRTRAVFYIGFSVTTGLVCSYVTALFIKDWRNNFLLSAITLFVITVAFYFIYESLARHMTVIGEEKRSVVSENEKEKTPFIIPFITSGVPLLLFVCMVQGLLNLGLKSLVPVMLMESYEAVSPQLANGLNIFLILASPLGIILARSALFKKISYPTTIAILMGVVVPMLVVMTFIGDIHIALIILALAILAVAVSIMSIFFSCVSRSFENIGASGTLAGMFNCMVALGIVLANYVFTLLAEKKGWEFTVYVWLALAALSLVLSIITVPLWKKFLNKNGKA